MMILKRKEKWMTEKRKRRVRWKMGKKKRRKRKRKKKEKGINHLVVCDGKGQNDPGGKSRKRIPPVRSSVQNTQTNLPLFLKNNPNKMT